MTNKEAIEILKGYKQRLENSCSNVLEEDIKAFNIAIMALEERPQNNLCWWDGYNTAKKIFERPTGEECVTIKMFEEEIKKIEQILSDNTPWHEKMDEAAWDRWNTTEKREALDNG